MRSITDEDIRVLHESAPSAIYAISSGASRDVISGLDDKYWKIVRKIETIKMQQDQEMIGYSGGGGSGGY